EFHPPETMVEPPFANDPTNPRNTLEKCRKHFKVGIFRHSGSTGRKNAVTAFIATGRIAGPKLGDPVPRSVPCALLCQRSAGSVSFDPNHLPDRKLYTGGRLEKRIQKRSEPPGVHAHAPVLVSRTYQAPGATWPEAVFAKCNLAARLHVPEHHPAWVL